MSIKHYGIYLAYPPTISLHKEGLGRFLAAFLRGAEKHRNVRFVVVCPSWSKDSLLDLCKSENVNLDSFDLVSRVNKPFLLRMYERYKLSRKKAQRESRFKQYFLDFYNDVLISYFKKPRDYLTQKLVGSCHGFTFSIYSVCLLPFIVLTWIVSSGCAALNNVKRVWKLCMARLNNYRIVASVAEKLRMVRDEPKNMSLVYRLYQAMEVNEIQLLIRKINKLTHVHAWYSPVAFWPSFNKINAPCLMSVPDVVLMDFPTGFSQVGGQRFLHRFNEIMHAIRGCDHYAVYSEYVKWHTLVDGCAINAKKIRVIHHAPNRLDQFLTTGEFARNERVTDYCTTLFRIALTKSSHPGYANRFENASVRFIFYASQFRPNKNVINLLKAYEYLLRKRFISHKLILTGDPNVMPEIEAFIRDHHLKNDVLCLIGLTSAELAAFYYLAELAVNPSLSEGGCPFTFTEALSVGTPVVMAKIPVTMEVLNDAALQDAMFFDPYHWKDMANRIEWGINNRAALLALQKPVYERLAQRTWSDVVNEYIAVLDEISAREHPLSAEAKIAVIKKPKLTVISAMDKTR